MLKNRKRNNWCCFENKQWEWSFLPLLPKGRFQILATSNSGQSAVGKYRGHGRWRTYRDADQLIKDRSSALGADRLLFTAGLFMVSFQMVSSPFHFLILSLYFPASSLPPREGCRCVNSPFQTFSREMLNSSKVNTIPSRSTPWKECLSAPHVRVSSFPPPDWKTYFITAISPFRWNCSSTHRF